MTYNRKENFGFVISNNFYGNHTHIVQNSVQHFLVVASKLIHFRVDAYAVSLLQSHITIDSMSLSAANLKRLLGFAEVSQILFNI